MYASVFLQCSNALTLTLIMGLTPENPGSEGVQVLLRRKRARCPFSKKRLLSSSNPAGAP
jgi:hypothetical protein